MEPTVLVVGSHCAPVCDLLTGQNLEPTRKVLIESKETGDSVTGSCERRIVVGRSSVSKPANQGMESTGSRSWSNGLQEIRDELDRTDFVIMATNLRTASGTYFSRYIARIARGPSPLIFSLVAGESHSGNTLQQSRIDGARELLSSKSDFLMSIPGGTDSVNRELAALVEKMVHRISHGTDTIGNLSRLVDSSPRSRHLLRALTHRREEF
ncbi:MAG: hypothetical protein ABEK50_10990 [bacterium]